MWDALKSRKPPWNQPQLTPFAFSRSPMFLPLTETVSRVEHLSKAGCGSPITDPATMSPAKKPTTLVAPEVWPENRLRAPGDDGPKVELNELSFMAKCWA